MQDLRDIHDEAFAAEVDKLVEFAEESRLTRSKQFDSRKRNSFGINLIVITGASSWFLWLLLSPDGDLRLAFISFVSMIFIPLLLHQWTMAPFKQYKHEFKSQLMPRMAKLLGNLKYSPSGGISMKAVMASRVVPAHTEYTGEDAFLGKYKDTKIMVSEARLKGKKKEPVFDGVFVLLMTPKDKFKGHTIITPDDKMIKRYSKSRWKHLQEVPFAPGIDKKLYHIYSDNPEEAKSLADEDMMELLHRLNHLFDDTQITAVFFKGNRVFLQIPYDGDMFEPGDIYMPITNKSHALKCKKEIEQIISIVDVLDVYEADSVKKTEENTAAEPAVQPQQQQQTEPASPASPPPPPPQQTAGPPQDAQTPPTPPEPQQPEENQNSPPLQPPPQEAPQQPQTEEPQTPPEPPADDPDRV